MRRSPVRVRSLAPKNRRFHHENGGFSNFLEWFERPSKWLGVNLALFFWRIQIFEKSGFWKTGFSELFWGVLFWAKNRRNGTGKIDYSANSENTELLVMLLIQWLHDDFGWNHNFPEDIKSCWAHHYLALFSMMESWFQCLNHKTKQVGHEIRPALFYTWAIMLRFCRAYFQGRWMLCDHSLWGRGRRCSWSWKPVHGPSGWTRYEHPGERRSAR